MTEIELKKFIKKLVEEEISNLDFSSQHHLLNYSNPLTHIEWGINEGLIQTYPIETTKKFIEDFYHLLPSQFNIEEQNGIKCAMLIIPNIGKNAEMIESSMFKLCGYFCSQKKEIDGMLYMQFEPKFSETENVTRYIFHVTPSYNLKKIQQIGLSPKFKNTLFSYPSRIYFWTEMASNENILSLISQLYYHNPNAKKNEGYSLIQVDTTKLGKSVKFYKDSNFPCGVYTLDIIPKEAIVAINSINMDIILKNKP